MSIEVKISAEEKDSLILIKDCTGSFSPSNTGGYGTQTFTKDQVTDSFLEIEPPSSKEPYPFKIQTYPGFPNSLNELKVYPSSIGAEEIESGKWKFKLTVVFTDKKGKETTVTANEVKVFIKNVSCCIDKMTANKLKPNALSDPKQRLVFELSNMLEGVKRQMKCGLYDKANETIEYLKSQCECCGCK